jgi:hypothetical protein
MKTFTKTTITQAPRLVIKYDESPESPRTWSNLGYFITIDRNYNSPDKNLTIEDIIKTTGSEAGSLEEHIKMITEQVQERTGQHIEAIYPICKYEHGGVSYSRGTVHGFDNSNNGFYIITAESAKELGVKKKDFEKVIDQEIEVYNNYANGECYWYELFDNDGTSLDSCSGFYNVNDIKDYLPSEWKDEDMSDYLVN